MLNPVRAGRVEEAGAGPWNRFCATAQEAPRPPWLDVAWLLSPCGREETRALLSSRRLVQEGRRAESPWAERRGHIWLGRASFREQMPSFIADQPLQDIPCGQTRPERPRARDLLMAVRVAENRPTHVGADRAFPPALRAWVSLLRRAANLRLQEVEA